ncbi:lysophospholipid acyltransferase family protein [Hippea maritima]|uniref:Phospholipid/glycerol acyltransferase n=1 Tax=Hippea maritima (strain ATCC 700847 / DSM 10411 / MH2) TaxID=760142 RepID=F2LXE7_HIPMA|nr:lysophospholipid acyltransferase family protein [Hippea maritima]AEA34261.1 phospholipid/glycerol acyltransferase [Hippea maritima DSM 10411]
MKAFFNFIRFALFTGWYIVKSKEIDENIIRRWVVDVLDMFKIDVECRGDFKDERFVIMPNHSSYFDILALYHCSRVKLNWIAKKELFKIPLLGRAMKDVGVVGVDRANEKKAAAALLRFVKTDFSGGVVIFPQGTRKNKTAFKRGGILIAKKRDLPIYPVRIENSAYIMPVGKLALNSGRVSVNILDRIDPKEFSDIEIEKMVREKVYD